MPYAIPSKKLVFFFCPKSGGTSLRAFLYHVENGFPYRESYVQGYKSDANSLIRNRRFRRAFQTNYQDFRRYALLRDPVRRFLSGYSNKVIAERVLSLEKLDERVPGHGLEPDPTLEEFVDQFADYFESVGTIGRHFSKQQAWIGNDPEFYEKIFRLDRVQELVDYTNNAFSSEAVMPRLRTEGPRIEVTELDPGLRRKIVNLVSDDIAFDVFPDMKDAYATELCA